MGQLLAEILNDMSDGKSRRALYTLFTKLLNNDSTSTHKAIVCGASATPISVAGSFTTGMEISADGTTAISVTSGFTGTTGILFNGTATNGISLTGACATAAISISGAEAIGLSILTSTPTYGISITANCETAALGITQTLAANDDHAIEVITTTAATGGTVRPIHMVSTMTGAGGVGGRAEFQCTISAALGGWANALKGYTVITTTTGSVSGLGSAVVSELLLPGSALSTGTYAVHEIELVTQASGSYTSPVSFIWCQVSGDGTATATFEDTGYLMTVKGLTEGTGNIFSAGADVAAAATLRIMVGDTAYYILLGAGEST